MNSEPRTVETMVSRGFVNDIVTEKLSMLGFTNNTEDAIAALDLPPMISMKIHINPEEVETIYHNGFK